MQTPLPPQYSRQITHSAKNIRTPPSQNTMKTREVKQYIFGNFIQYLINYLLNPSEMSWCLDTHTAIQIFVSVIRYVPCILWIIPARLENNLKYLLWYETRYKDAYTLFILRKETYLNRHRKCLHADSAHSLKTIGFNQLMKQKVHIIILSQWRNPH